MRFRDGIPVVGLATFALDRPASRAL